MDRDGGHAYDSVRETSQSLDGGPEVNLEDRSAATNVPKRPRVSFASVETRMFNKGSDDPKMLSTPQERVLSPLDASTLSEENTARVTGPFTEDSTEYRFPNLLDLCRTPDGFRRDSLLSNASVDQAENGLGDMQRRLRNSFRPSSGAQGQRHGSFSDADQKLASAPEEDDQEEHHAGHGDEVESDDSCCELPSKSWQQAFDGVRMPASLPESIPLTPIPDEGSMLETLAEQADYTGEFTELTAEMDGFAAVVDSELAASGSPGLTPTPHHQPRQGRLSAGSRRASGGMRSSSGGEGRNFLSPGAFSERSEFCPSEWDVYEKFAQGTQNEHDLTNCFDNYDCDISDNTDNNLTDTTVEISAELPSKGVFEDLSGENLKDFASTETSFCDQFLKSEGGLISSSCPPEWPCAREDDQPECSEITTPVRNRPTSRPRSPSNKDEWPQPCLGNKSALRRPVNAGPIENTVDVGPIKSAMQERRESHSRTDPDFIKLDLGQPASMESRVAEGRRSFPTRIGSRDALEKEGKAGEDAAVQDEEKRKISALPTPMRSPSPAASKGTAPEEMFKSSPPGKFSLFGNPSGLMRRSNCRSDVPDSPDSCISVPLAGTSTLQTIPFPGKDCRVSIGSICRNPRLSWNEFIDKCRLGIENTDVPPELPLLHHTATSSDARRGGCTEEDADGRRRSELVDTLREVRSRIATCTDKLAHSSQTWDQADGGAAIAEKLMDAMQEPIELETFRSQVRRWHGECLAAAKHDWRCVKRELASKELFFERGVTEEIRKELASCQDAGRADDASRTGMQSRRNRVVQRTDAREMSDQFTEFVESQAKSVNHEQRFMQQNVQRAQIVLETDRQNQLAFRRKLDALRAQVLLEKQQRKEAKAKLSLLKVRRAELDVGQHAKTCYVAESTLALTGLALRGGARLNLQYVGASGPNLVRAALIPPDYTSATQASLVEDLYGLVWRDAMSSVVPRRVTSECAQKQFSIGNLRAVVAEHDVRHLALRLSESSVHAWIVLKAIEDLPKECADVAQVEAKFSDDGKIALAVAFIIVHSHDVLGGRGGVVADHSARITVGNGLRVDVTKCVVELHTSLESFPNNVDTRAAVVHWHFGPGDSATVQAALREHVDNHAKLRHNSLLWIAQEVGRITRRSVTARPFRRFE